VLEIYATMIGAKQQARNKYMLTMTPREGICHIEGIA
jgi:hypothetical protein